MTERNEARGSAPENDMMESLALDTLAEIANDNLAERMRQEAAARILVTARRLRPLATTGEEAIEAPAANWDPAAVTALEFAEGLSPRALDNLLGAAPRWARRLREQAARAGRLHAA